MTPISVLEQVIIAPIQLQVFNMIFPPIFGLNSCVPNCIPHTQGLYKAGKANRFIIPTVTSVSPYKSQLNKELLAVKRIVQLVMTYHHS